MKKIKPYNGRILTTKLALDQVNVVQMPKRAQVLGVHFDFDGDLWLSSAGVADSENWIPRRFAVIADGMHLPHHLGVLTQVAAPVVNQHGSWHVFEIESPEYGSVVGAARGVTVTNHQEGRVNGPSIQVGVLGGGLNVGGPGVMIQ